VRANAPFSHGDLRDLERTLLCHADAVVAMRDIHAGARSPDVIGMRHDVDNSFYPSVELARWEAERGYRSTYFILHDSPYWDEPGLQAGLDEIAELGHEIGIHTNAIAVSLRTGLDPHMILDGAITRLRSWGHPVTGVVGHGDPLCYQARFVNDEQFLECARPEMGSPTRTLRHDRVTLKLNPRSIREFGLEYESLRCAPRAMYLSDSGGRWNEPFDELADRFPAEGQLHILMHPDWWHQAFVREEVAA
jgi:hypothetical protein